MPLNLRQERFAAAYLESGNATDAARQAGYPFPEVKGTQLLDNVKVQQRIAEARAAIRAAGIAAAEHQLRTLQADFDRLDRIIAERAVDPKLALVPGGKTGLVVVRYKTLPAEGEEKARVVQEHAVDTGLLSARLALMQHAGRVAGWWTEKRELTAELRVRADDSPRERLTARIDELAARRRAAPPAEPPAADAGA